MHSWPTRFGDSSLFVKENPFQHNYCVNRHREKPFNHLNDSRVFGSPFKILRVAIQQSLLITPSFHRAKRSHRTMAPRQRNVSTPTASEDESCSDDAAATTASSQELRSRSNRKSLETKTASPKKSEITDADIARDNHDYFNVVALAMVVNTIGLNYEFPSLSYTGDHFWTMWAVSLCRRLTLTKMKGSCFWNQAECRPVTFATFERCEPHLILFVVQF